MSGKTIYVGNLNYRRDEKGIMFLFSKYGYIQEIKIPLDPKTKLKKGLAFVHMPNGKDADKAIAALNGMEVDGRTLKVSEAIESIDFKINATGDKKDKQKKKDDKEDKLVTMMSERRTKRKKGQLPKLLEFLESRQK